VKIKKLMTRSGAAIGAGVLALSMLTIPANAAPTPTFTASPIWDTKPQLDLSGTGCQSNGKQGIITVGLKDASGKPVDLDPSSSSDLLIGSPISGGEWSKVITVPAAGAYTMDATCQSYNGTLLGEVSNKAVRALTANATSATSTTDNQFVGSEVITVQSKGWAANETVTLTVNGTKVGSGTADSDGVFIWTGKLPKNLQTAKDYTFVLTGAGGDSVTGSTTGTTSNTSTPDGSSSNGSKTVGKGKTVKVTGKQTG
jgi:hypothetical protein